MPIKTIILHQGRDTHSPRRLKAAAALAARHDAHLIGVFVNASAADLVNMEWAIGSKGVEKWLASSQEAHDRAKEAFEACLSSDKLSGEWRTMEGTDAQAMMAAGRHGDLTILGQTDPDERAYDGGMPDDVVLGAGGPVLIVPYAGSFSAFGKRMMIAWNGSREAARAAKDAMPFLQQAGKVLVYSVAPEGGTRSSGAEICSYLARHGVEAELAQGARGAEADAVDSTLETIGDFGFQQRGAWTYSRHHAVEEINVGDALLSAVADNAIDLLVMGAYGHARLREMVFGGATRHILQTMTVPVLMSN